jgi:hypothetical protein
VDKKNFDKSETLLNVDTQSGQFCLAGRAVGIDPTTTFNRQVVFTYSSLGDITKANTKSVKGDFSVVTLQLTIDELNPDGAINEFTGVIQADCKLKGSLQKEGEAAKAKLNCDLGENLSAFGLVPADAESQNDQALIDNVSEAFAKRKNLSVKVKNGKLKFTHNGEPAPGDLTVPLTCDLGGNPE